MNWHLASGVGVGTGERPLCLIPLNFVNCPQRVNMHRLSGRDEVDLQHVRLLVGPTAPSAERSRQIPVSWPSASVPCESSRGGNILDYLHVY
jgi:hypothetical protein